MEYEELLREIKDQLTYAGTSQNLREIRIHQTNALRLIKEYREKNILSLEERDGLEKLSQETEKGFAQIVGGNGILSRILKESLSINK